MKKSCGPFQSTLAKARSVENHPFLSESFEADVAPALSPIACGVHGNSGVLAPSAAIRADLSRGTDWTQLMSILDLNGQSS